MKISVDFTDSWSDTLILYNISTFCSFQFQSFHFRIYLFTTDDLQQNFRELEMSDLKIIILLVEDNCSSIPDLLTESSNFKQHGRSWKKQRCKTVKNRSTNLCFYSCKEVALYSEEFSVAGLDGHRAAKLAAQPRGIVVPVRGLSSHKRDLNIRCYPWHGYFGPDTLKTVREQRYQDSENRQV